VNTQDNETSRDPSARAVLASRSGGVDVALVIGADGSVHSVLKAPGDGDADGLDSVEALWAGPVVDRVRQLARGTLKSREFTCETIAADGQDFEFTFVAQGRDRVLLLMRDVSERSLALAHIQQLAYVDDVTKLPNRKFLRRELDAILDNLRLTEGRVALIYFDVDQGTSQGMFYNPRRQERVLRELAARLMQELRGVNDRNPVDYERYSAAARIDYSQFAVVLPSIEGGEAAERVTRRLIDSLTRPIRIDEREIRVAVKAGIALTPQDGTDSGSLMEKAAAAMDVARSSATENYKFYTGTAKLPALQRKDMELELRSALDREEFALEFLPIVDAETTDVVAVEALLRWPQTLFAARSIAQVVSLAEHTGLILPIGEWVLRTACARIAALRAAGHRGLRLAVNLSVQEFSRPDLAETIAAAIDESGLPPAALQFEINEYMLFRDAMRELQACRALRALGVGLTVDDFGTGACSLSHLAHSPVDTLKIDKTFVEHAPDSPKDRTACVAAASMARELGVTVIAEGVETEAQAELARKIGCDQLQGFLFSRPLGADELLRFLTSEEEEPEPA